MQDNLFKKGRANFSKGNYRAACKNFKEIIELNPYLINGWINLGNVYIKLKIYSVNKVHLMSFHYAAFDIEDKPYK